MAQEAFDSPSIKRVTNCRTGGATEDELMIERTIEDIAEALGPHGAAPRRCSVLLGAGCSISAGIPSASEIVRQIKFKFPAAYARAASHDYPDCMAALERCLASSNVDGGGK